MSPLEAALTSLPDPNDRHVLAAAIHAGAQEIVTFNLLDLNSEAVCEAVRRIRRRLANPPCSAEEMVANYERHGARRKRIDPAIPNQLPVTVYGSYQAMNEPIQREILFLAGNAFLGATSPDTKATFQPLS